MKKRMRKKWAKRQSEADARAENMTKIMHSYGRGLGLRVVAKRVR